MPDGWQTFSGSADPNWRMNQLQRLGGVAQLLMQQSEERKEREKQRLDERVKLASSAIAAGGDVAHPAVQSALNDLRQAGTKRGFRNEGYDKIADLLELNWKAKENDPDSIKQRTEQKMLQEAMEFQQSFQAGMGTGMGINAGMAPPTALETQRHVASTVPGAGMFADTRELYPDEYRAPAKPIPVPAALQRDEQMQEWLDSGDPQRVAAAEQYFKLKAPPASTAAQEAITARMRERNAEVDARDDEDDARKSLEIELKDRVTAWDAEASRHRTSQGADTTWEAANPRPKMPNVEAVKKALDEVDELPNLDEETRAGLREYIKKKALEGKLALARVRLKNRPEVSANAASGP